MMKRLLCINQFVPPDKAPTSMLLQELRDGLAGHGWEVEFLGGARNYRSGKPKGWRRWWREATCHLSLIWRGLSIKRPSIVLCLTDPPGLPFTAAIIAKLRGAKLVHWAMDVYPEVAAALGEIRPESPVYRLVSAATKAGYARCAMIACLDEDMAELMRLKGDPRLMICPPWPPSSLVLPTAPITPSSSRIMWLYSGNLGRAHDYETLLQAQRLLEEAGATFELVFQGGGTMYAEARQRAVDLGVKHCRWEGYAADPDFVASLLSAHVLVATQKTETCGMLWPSKLALLRELPRPIVWVGPPGGAIAENLRSSGARHGIFTPGEHEALAQWLMARAEALRLPPASPRVEDLGSNLSQLREGLLDRWRKRLAELS